jgi:hypothetical protein
MASDAVSDANRIRANVLRGGLKQHFDRRTVPVDRRCVRKDHHIVGTTLFDQQMVVSRCNVEKARSRESPSYGGIQEEIKLLPAFHLMSLKR